LQDSSFPANAKRQTPRSQPTPIFQYYPVLKPSLPTTDF